jgi:acyl-coenzyme A thioesterase PaaI-like protein
MVKDVVTMDLNENFPRKPGPYDLIAEGRLLKCGRRLVYGEVTMFSEGQPHDACLPCNMHLFYPNKKIQLNLINKSSRKIIH